MAILYPKDYVEPAPETKPAKSNVAAVAAIKAMAASKPVPYEDAVKAVQASERAAGRYWTNDELHALVAAVDAEWHPAPKAEVEVIK